MKTFTKEQIQARVLQRGKPIGLDKFNWCDKTNTFTTDESNLVLDFNNIDGITFKTGVFCTFKTGHGCTFKTGHGCTFKTWYGCTFDTWHGCTFKTGALCTFKTGALCTFDTGYGCTFDTWHACTFKTGKECVVIRRDVYEVIELKECQTIKLNHFTTKGFTILN